MAYMSNRARDPGIKESIFAWEGKDKTGKTVRGELRAGGEAVVNVTLHNEGELEGLRDEVGRLWERLERGLPGTVRDHPGERHPRVGTRARRASPGRAQPPAEPRRRRRDAHVHALADGGIEAGGQHHFHAQRIHHGNAEHRLFLDPLAG